MGEYVSFVSDIILVPCTATLFRYRLLSSIWSEKRRPSMRLNSSNCYLLWVRVLRIFRNLYIKKPMKINLRQRTIIVRITHDSWTKTGIRLKYLKIPNLYLKVLLLHPENLSLTRHIFDVLVISIEKNIINNSNTSMTKIRYLCIFYPSRAKNYIRYNLLNCMIL